MAATTPVVGNSMFANRPITNNMAAECENFVQNCFYWCGKWFYVEENWKIELYIDTVNKRRMYSDYIDFYINLQLILYK